MFRLTEEKLKKFIEIEDWDSSEVEKLMKHCIEEPIYVWGGKDEKEVFDYFKEKGYTWGCGMKLEKVNPGLTWGYPVVFFVEEGGALSYNPVDFGRDTDEEPSLD